MQSICHYYHYPLDEYLPFEENHAQTRLALNAMLPVMPPLPATDMTGHRSADRKKKKASIKRKGTKTNDGNVFICQVCAPISRWPTFYRFRRHFDSHISRPFTCTLSHSITPFRSFVRATDL